MSYEEMKDYLDRFTTDLIIANEQKLEVLQANSNGSKIRDISEMSMPTEYEMYAY